jgi:hypothetical protein
VVHADWIFDIGPAREFLRTRGNISFMQHHDTVSKVRRGQSYFQDTREERTNPLRIREGDENIVLKLIGHQYYFAHLYVCEA